MTPPTRPDLPPPRTMPSRPAPPRPAPPRPRRAAGATPRTPSPSSATGSAMPDQAVTLDPGASAPPTDAVAPAAPVATELAAQVATEPEPVGKGDVPLPPSATSDAVTTYSARRRALGIPVRPGVVSGGSAARFAERAAMRRRLARHKAYGVAAVLVVVGFLVWLLGFAPVLALHPAQVRVTGAGTVVDVADVHAVVAQVDGVPLPRLDTVGLRDRVLEVPGVRQAKVTRSWPHGLAIVLESREPVAAVPHRATGPSGGAPEPGYALMDAEGYSVGWVPTPPDGLPVVSVPVVRDGPNRSLDAVLTILEALPPELAAEVGTIEAESRDTVRMGLRNGKSVVWGSAADAELKIRVLQALRAAPAAADAREYDVSAPTLPITR